ncbi:MAG: Gfo/Idh/MocA family oxidoreductase [Clostridia bacterium]|nr:Gfo/Idh/MocA family oxidoreductase [Clostridia bacterium]
MDTSKPIRIGVVGTNFVSDWLCEAAAVCDGVQVTAVYSRARETGDAFAEKHGISHVFCEYEAFVSSDTIDAVYIASPNFAHAAQAVRALRAHKHVLCEKVIATNAHELSEMIAAAKVGGCVLLEAMRPSFDPAIALVREQLPRLGRLRRVVLDFNQYSSRYDRFKAGDVANAFNPAYSNAAVMDIGVYIIHIAAKLFGRPQRIVSMSTFLHNGFEGSGHVLLDYGDMKAELSYSKITESVTPNLFIGEDAALMLDKIAAPKKMQICYHRGSPNHGTQGTWTEDIPVCTADNNMIYELEAFARLCRAGRWDHAYLENSVIEMEIIDEIRRQNGIIFPADAEAAAPIL